MFIISCIIIIDVNQRRAQDQVRQWFSDYGSCAKFLVKTQLLEAKRNAAKEERKEREAAQAARMALIQREEQQQQQQLQLQSPLTTPTLTSTKLEKMNNNNSTMMQYQQQQQHDTTSSTGFGGRLSPTGVDHSSIDPISPRESIYSSAASSAANLEHFNLDDEEDRDKDAVTEFMKKYNKLWKNLFTRYQNVSFSHKNQSDMTSFDRIQNKNKEP